MQMPLVHAGYLYGKLRPKREPEPWVVGSEEIAEVIATLATVLKPACSVNLHTHRFYSHRYSFEVQGGRFAGPLKRLLAGPLLLGYLARNHDNFLYIWETGFLLDREAEFAFLKSKDKAIVNWFCGSDIRSPRKLIEFCREHDFPCWFERYDSDHPMLQPSFEAQKMRVAAITDAYADVIMTTLTDQIGYLQRPIINNYYMLPDEKLHRCDEKFESLSVPKVVHAPSNAAVKGTADVRAAVERLQAEGLAFEYVELQGVPNEVVMEHLRSAHIVLNQFYGMLPGLFGMEAMGSHCAVLQSADPKFEPGLLPDCEGAWLPTRPEEIYAHLKKLLEDPDLIKGYADRGFEVVERHFVVSKAGKAIRAALAREGLPKQR